MSRHLALILPGRLAGVQALPDHAAPSLPPVPVAATLTGRRAIGRNPADGWRLVSGAVHCIAG